MPLSFAVVAVETVGKKRFIPGEATVSGLGVIEAPTREAFCKAAGTAIFEKHPDISEVRFVGPGRDPEVRITREATLQ